LSSDKPHSNQNRNLTAAGGVKEVEVDFETKVATVIFDASETTASDIGDASTDVGSPASELVEE